MPFPRAYVLYRASEVVAYIKEADKTDVTPYLAALWKQAGGRYDAVLCVSSATNNFKMRELKELIYKYLGARVFIIFDLDPGYYTGIMEEGE